MVVDGDPSPHPILQRCIDIQLCKQTHLAIPGKHGNARNHPRPSISAGAPPNVSAAARTGTVFQPSRLHILAIGRVKPPWLAEGVVHQYQRRLPGVQLVEVKDSTPGREATEVRAGLRPVDAIGRVLGIFRKLAAMVSAAH